MASQCLSKVQVLNGRSTDMPSEVSGRPPPPRRLLLIDNEWEERAPFLFANADDDGRNEEEREEALLRAKALAWVLAQPRRSMLRSVGGNESFILLGECLKLIPTYPLNLIP